MASFSEKPAVVEFTNQHGKTDHASLHARGRRLFVRTSSHVFEINLLGIPPEFKTHNVHDIARLGGILNAEEA